MHVHRKSLLALAMALSFALAGCGALGAGSRQAAQQRNLHGLSGEPPPPAPDFTLTDQNGKPFRLSDQRGKVVLLFFGYTSCPDVCPTTLGDLRRVRKLLGNDAEHVKVVLVTVDPERDSPERLGTYVTSAGDPTFVGLTGDRRALEQVWREYGVFVQRDPAPESAVGYTITHGARVYLVSPDGKLATTYAFGTPAKDIAADIRRILQGG